MTSKPQLHPRNRHKQGYDFQRLCQAYPKLLPFVFTNQYDNQTIDFSDADAVMALNTAILKSDYQIEHWQIPKGYLCPPIPGRADYIHYLADLLKETNNNKPAFKNVAALDIGTGASCIYPILASRIYSWRIVASDIDPVSINCSSEIIKANTELADNIECRLQAKPKHVFRDIIKNNEKFDVTLCNPPFHESLEKGLKGSQQKWKNLNKKKKKDPLNFGGQKAELWCKGGELRFIKDMIKESKAYSEQVLWFTSLVSKNENISKLKLALKKANAKEIKVIKMAQGNKTSRFIAWTFLPPEQREAWCESRF